ncbi:MAG: DNA-formamidopyrimidine glycosylase family protein [Phycisphaeraceae bacterium]
MRMLVLPMPELPDILVYLDALAPRVLHQPLERVRIVSPFLVRSVDPPVSEIEGKRIVALRRLGKRIVWDFEGDLAMILHLMIAGRLRWSDKRDFKVAGKGNLASFTFPTGTLTLTEAGTKRRASLHIVQGAAAMADHARGDLDVLAADLSAFAATLTRENHTLKRALTDPRLFDGIGNAYSDEILHAARLSPVMLTSRLTAVEITGLHTATCDTLNHWIARLREQFRARFPGPGDITAFRPDFAVHGKFGQPCPICGTKVQRIRYAENETNYCPRCQTQGKLLADRSLSRLLHDDWPKTIDEWERA